jgi:hypothetical protein
MNDTTKDVKARNTVDRIAFSKGGSNTSDLLSCGAGGSVALKTASRPIKLGRGRASRSLRCQPPGVDPAG